MKIIKTLAAVMIALNLIAAAGLAMGSAATSRAISETAIEKAITATGAVDELTDRIIAQRTVNMGGRYGETMQTILKSDAMTAFFTEYTARALQSQIYDIELEEIGSDELNRAFSEGADECLAEGSISMGSTERLIFDKALNLAMPVLTEGINYVLKQMDLTDFVDGETAGYIETAKLLVSDKVRFGSAAFAVVMCVVLIAIFGGSMAGFVWAGVCILLDAVLLLIMSVMLGGSMQADGAELALSTRMMYVMMSEGLSYAGIAGGIPGAALIAIRGAIRGIFKS